MLPAGELSTWNVAVQPASLVLSNCVTVNADCLFVLDALIAGVTGSDDAAAALGDALLGDESAAFVPQAARVSPPMRTRVEAVRRVSRMGSASECVRCCSHHGRRARCAWLCRPT